MDSLGTWVAAHLELEQGPWRARCEELIAAIDACRGSLVVVCEETGWGVVPATAAGWPVSGIAWAAMQQRLLGRSEAAWLVLQGRAIDLLGLSQPVPPC